MARVLPAGTVGVSFYLANIRSLRTLLWVDGTIIVLVLVAASFALFLGTTINAADAPASFVRGQVVYPVLDLVFVAFALVLGFAGRWRLGPASFLAGGAALTLLVTDLVYFDQLANVTYVPGTVLDAGWALTMLLMSVAATLHASSTRAGSAHDAERQDPLGGHRPAGRPPADLPTIAAGSCTRGRGDPDGG